MPLGVGAEVDAVGEFVGSEACEGCGVGEAPTVGELVGDIGEGVGATGDGVGLLVGRFVGVLVCAMGEDVGERVGSVVGLMVVAG